MNKRVFVAMLMLSIFLLAIMYILKIFFPAEFVFAIENEHIIAVGDFIDSHEWAYFIFGSVTSFITYWLYCCACSHQKFLKWYECLAILVVVVIVRIINYFDVNLSSIISITSFIFLPAIMKGDIKTCAIVYTVHGINQGLTLKIRDIGMFVQHMNSLTTLLLAIDMYFWLILFYVVFNYKKGDRKNGD